MKKPLKVEFILTSEKDFIWTPRPVPAIKSLPNWYAEQSSYTDKERRVQNSGAYNHTIKKCMPVFDVMSAGYIFKTICDFNVINSENNVQWQWSIDGFKAIESHKKPQFSAMPIDKNLWHTDVIFKFVNPWIMRTPKGYSTLFIAPFHNYDLPFECLPAVVDTDKHPVSVNFPFFLKKDFKGLIPAETPIIQAIPFKRDNWKAEFLTEPIEKSEGELGKGLTKFGNRYKTFWREIKTYD
jgi:hypothetical protein